MASRVRIKDHWREQRLYEQRILIAAFVVLLMVGTLVGRLVWLQIVKHDYFAELSQGNRVRIEPLPAARGTIYDRNGEVLAENRPAYQLELVPEAVPDLEDTLRRLVEIELLEAADLDEVRRIIRARRRFESVPIRLRLTEDEIARFAVRQFDFDGVDLKTRLARFYPHGEIAVHALGHVGALSEADLARVDRAAYAGTSTIGKLGVESAFESLLHGRNGRREVLVNARGRSVQLSGSLGDALRNEPATQGQDVILSLDLEVQKVAEQAVWDQRAAVVALDPANGDVIALVSRPGFDPNAFARGLTRPEFAALNENIDRPLFNRALRGTYPPGSTIKPLIALAGLTYDAIDTSDSVYCRGFYSLPGSRHRFRDWKRQGHGRLSMIQAVAQSCDVYFYILSNALGPTRIAEFLGQFGLGAATGIDIGGERPGILPSPAWKKKTFSDRANQVWFPGETVIFGIGQGYMTSTPLQIAHMTALIGARGQNFAPRLVTATRDPVTRTTTQLEPVPLPAVQASSPEHWQTAVDSMLAVMEGGTASRSAAGAGYRIAGKTGTAQVFTVAQDEEYDERRSRNACVITRGSSRSRQPRIRRSRWRYWSKTVAAAAAPRHRSRARSWMRICCGNSRIRLPGLRRRPYR